MGADGFFSIEKQVAYASGAVSQPPPDRRAAHAAANGFAEASPDCSAHTALTPGQSILLKRLFAVIGISTLAAPGAIAVVGSGLGLALFIAILLWRIALVLEGVRLRWQAGPRGPAPEYGAELPIYTLLIALYDEADTAAQLSAAIGRLDYPPERLDVKLLLEAVDKKTKNALLAQAWPAGTELLVLPDGKPRTKPRALNYGLARARGEFVVVYDAEDRPDPAQLRAAIAAFSSGSPDLACVQAPLVGDGGKAAWLPGQWALEYAIQFGLLLPALAKWGLPIALGGTSNHFRRSALEDAGGWDAWNVTEDADLGLRLARRGQRVGVIAPPTLEAPPAKLNVWIAQRSRWLKGFLQSWLVIMRRPRRAITEMGLGGFVSMQLTLGASLLSAIAHAPWALWCLACALHPSLSLGPVALALLAVTYITGIATALMAAPRRSAGQALLAFTLPIYWPLQSIAMLRALYGLCVCPHFWAKTPHEATETGRSEPCSTGHLQLPGLLPVLPSPLLPTGAPASQETILPEFGSHGSR